MGVKGAATAQGRKTNMPTTPPHAPCLNDNTSMTFAAPTIHKTETGTRQRPTRGVRAKSTKTRPSVSAVRAGHYSHPSASAEHHHSARVSASLDHGPAWNLDNPNIKGPRANEGHHAEKGRETREKKEKAPRAPRPSEKDSRQQLPRPVWLDRQAIHDKIDLRLSDFSDPKTSGD